MLCYAFKGRYWGSEMRGGGKERDDKDNVKKKETRDEKSLIERK